MCLYSDRLAPRFPLRASWSTLHLGSHVQYLSSIKVVRLHHLTALLPSARPAHAARCFQLSPAPLYQIYLMFDLPFKVIQYLQKTLPAFLRRVYVGGPVTQSCHHFQPALLLPKIKRFLLQFMPTPRVPM